MTFNKIENEVKKLREMWKKIKRNKKKIFFQTGFLASVVFLFLFIDASQAQAEFSPKGFATAIATQIVLVVYKVAVFLFSIARWFLNLVLDPNVYGSALFSPTALAGINTAWSFIRDFFNMFFILIVLMMAISTILGVERFNAKKNIFNVVGAAILINFSKAISLVILDVSQIAMGFFLNSVNGDRFTFADSWGSNMDVDHFIDQAGSGSVGPLVAAAACTIFILIATFMFSVLALALLVRVLAFYVLIVLSPFAMFGLALKGTKFGGAMTSDWFTKITKWAFFGPILAFFLYIAFILLEAVNSVIDTPEFRASFNADISGKSEVNSGNTSGILSYIIPYTAGIYLLFYGFDLAMKSSTGAAQSILKWGNGKLNKWTNGMAGGVTGFAVSPATALWNKGVKPRFGGLAEGFRDKKRKAYNPLGLLKTKAKKDEIAKDMRAKYKAIGGGEDMKKYQEKKQLDKINEEAEKVRKAGLTKDQMTDAIKKGKLSPDEKAGYAKRLLKENKIGNKDDYRRVLEIAGSNELVRGQFEDMMKKNNAKLFLDEKVKRETDNKMKELGNKGKSRDEVESETKQEVMEAEFKNKNFDYFMDQVKNDNFRNDEEIMKFFTNNFQKSLENNPERMFSMADLVNKKYNNPKQWEGFDKLVKAIKENTEAISQSNSKENDTDSKEKDTENMKNHIDNDGNPFSL